MHTLVDLPYKLLHRISDQKNPQNKYVTEHNFAASSFRKSEWGLHWHQVMHEDIDIF